MRAGSPPRAISDPHRTPSAGDHVRTAQAGRTNLVLLAFARGTTLIATAALAFLSPINRPWILLGLAVVAAVFMVASTVGLRLASERSRPSLVHLVLTLDLLLWLGGCAASGAHESYALMMYVVFPSIGALMMTTSALVTSAITIVLMRPLLGGDLDEILAFYVLAAWAFAVAIAARYGRNVFVRRLQRLDETWSSLARGPSEAVRERVADDLRHGVLDPVRAIRERIADAEGAGTAAPGGGALVEDLRAIIERVREIANELYAPPGVHCDLHGGLRHLARRRSRDATVGVTVHDPVPAALATPLEAVVRDALGLVAGRRTRTIEIDVRCSTSGAAAKIRVSPASELDPLRRDLRLASLRARAGVGDVRVDPGPDGTMTVRARLAGVALPDPAERRIRGLAFREIRSYIVAARLGLVPVAIAIPLLIGGTTAAYPWAAVAVCLYLAGTAWFFRTARSDRCYYVGLGLDFVCLTGFLLTVGDARPFLLPVALLIPVAQSVVLPWSMSLPIALGLAVGLPLTGPTPQPAITIALLWAAVIAMVLVRERSTGSARLYTAALRRDQLLQGLLEAEDVERRRLAERLHDDVLQLLFGARQDLLDAADEAGGAAAALASAAATLGLVLDRLAETVSDLDVDEGAAEVTGGLKRALTVTASRHDGPDAQVHVDPQAAGVHDGLLVQFVRELYRNSVRHSRASTVQLSVVRGPERIVLDDADDGVGFDFHQVDSALDRGGLGLASLHDRTTWSGGTVELGASEHGGARVLIALPLSEQHPAPERPPVPPTPDPRAPEPATPDAADRALSLSRPAARR